MIIGFTPEELEEIRKADEAMSRPGHGGDRRSANAHVNHLGNPLWEWRVMRGLTQAEAGELLHYTQQTISAMECGRYRIPQYVIEFIRKDGQDDSRTNHG